jgi:hypothetical protein
MINPYLMEKAVGRVTTAWMQEVEQRREQLPSPQGVTRQIEANMSGYAALTRPTQGHEETDA